jgi:ribonuclease HI
LTRYPPDAQHKRFLDALIVATNSQNSIRPEDLLSNDIIQKKLQDIFHEYGIGYERKEGEMLPRHGYLTTFTKEQAAMAYLGVMDGWTTSLKPPGERRFQEGSSRAIAMTMTEPKPDRKHVTIYTDGGCEPNPGRGGYGVVLEYAGKRKEASGGFRRTTNNRMEILAAIVGLEMLKEPCRVTLYSDSQYVVHAMTKGWVERWQKKNWWRTKDERALNVDLWKRLMPLCEKHEVAFEWVRGHVGNAGNERCDVLAGEALRAKDLPVDENYESPREEDLAPKPTFAEGDACHKCGTPLVKRTSKKKPKGDFYYEYFLYCPTCHTAHVVESAKRPVEKEPSFL